LAITSDKTPLFVDDAGREWGIYDFVLEPTRCRRVPTSDRCAEYRAFVAKDDPALVMVYSFGTIAYRDIELKNLAQQLHFAKPKNSMPKFAKLPLKSSLR
jgi:hypothetical protein